jgi:hypothetical protein
MANIHDLRTGSEGDVDDSSNATKHQNVSPADLCKVLSSTIARYSGPGTKPTSTDGELLVINGKKYRSINETVRYSISAHRSSNSGALVDRGANGALRRCSSLQGSSHRVAYQVAYHQGRRIYGRFQTCSDISAQAYPRSSYRSGGGGFCQCLLPSLRLRTRTLTPICSKRFVRFVETNWMVLALMN